MNISSRFFRVCGSGLMVMLLMGVFATSALVDTKEANAACVSQAVQQAPWTSYETCFSHNSQCAHGLYTTTDLQGMAEEYFFTNPGIVPCNTAYWNIGGWQGTGIHYYLFVPSKYSNTNACVGFYYRGKLLNNPLNSCVDENQGTDQWLEIKPSPSIPQTQPVDQLKVISNTTNITGKYLGFSSQFGLAITGEFQNVFEFPCPKTGKMDPTRNCPGSDS